MEESVFLQHAIGLLAARTAANHPAFRVGRTCSNASACQSRRIERAKVPGLVNQGNRQIARYRIQIVSCGVALFLQLRVVIAKAQHDAQLLDLGRDLDVFAQRLLQIGDGSIASIRGRQQIGSNRLQPHAADMAVRVHEPGKQRAPLQIHHARSRAAHRLQLLQRAGGRDQPSRDGHRLHLRLGVVHGENRAAKVNGICRLDRSRLARSTAREPGC